MSASTPVAIAPTTVPARVGLLRTGLVLAAVYSVFGLIPLFAMGFNGSGWDVVLIVFAVISVIVAAGCIAASVFGWNGRPVPAIIAVVLTIVSVVPSLPAFFLPLAETTAEGPGPLLAAIGIVITVVIVALILVGLRRVRPRSTRRAS